MKLTGLLFILVLPVLVYAQLPATPPKFSPAELKADLAFLKQQVFNVHANPFTEINETAYERLFAQTSGQLTDSMDAAGFFKLVRPLVAPLSDEHAQIRLDTRLQTPAFKSDSVFLPFSLTASNGVYRIDTLLANIPGINKNDVMLAVDGQPIRQVVDRCAAYTTGFPDQRAKNALQQFGYLYTLARPGFDNRFTITLAGQKAISLSGIPYPQWVEYLTRKRGLSPRTKQTIQYTRYGDAGYLNITAFNARTDREMDSLRNVVAGMFSQMKAEKVNRLFIDISRNGGGNSAVGDMLIDFFYGKPYRGYRCNWKRSAEYLTLINSWGINDDFYKQQKVGTIIRLPSQVHQLSASQPARFEGKTYIIIGDGTFSSAIMFATTVKDNHIAKLIGQVPKEGHPNHFGEMYAAKLPNTKLDVQFGVKEWIRPAEDAKENQLIPDQLVDLSKGPEGIIKQVQR